MRSHRIVAYLLMGALPWGVASCGGAREQVDVAGIAAEIRSTESFESVVEAARNEGALHISSYSAPTPALESTVRAFEEIYGITVHLSALGTSQFITRMRTEERAGKQSTDLRLSSYSDAVRLSELELDAPFGELPSATDPDAEWLPAIDPLREIREGRHSLIYRATGWTILANSHLVPRDLAPTSWRELADSRFRNQLYVFDPRVNGPGCDLFMHLYLAYGEEWGLRFLGNVAAFTRTPYQAEKQVARGEYAMTLPSSSAGMAPLWRIPEPRPVYIVEPRDGVIVIVSTLTLLKGAQHPNAARVWANFLLSRGAQQIQANEAGGGAIRADVTFPEPELAFYATQPAFPGTPESFEWRSQPEHNCAELVPRLLEQID